MKILKRQISAKDASGMVLLRPDTPEDLWHAFNLLTTGDLVRCTTVRKVVKESSTGSTSSNKKRMMLTIDIQKVDFDPDVLQLRVSGTVQSENDLVRLGAHHTLTLELNQNFSIEKQCWDQIYLDRLDEAIHPERQAEIAAVVMQTGLAHVCLVTGALTITKARIDMNIPKKRPGSSQHSKAITRFYENVYQAVLRHIDFAKVKAVLIGSPGFVKNDFYQYMLAESVRRDDRPFIENKQKFVLCKASSGHKHALEEVFSDPAIMAQMTETKVAREVEILNKFMRMMENNPDKAYYGYDHVAKAHEQLAIDSLLVTDELFRNTEVKTRKKYVQLVESVRENGGTVFIFSSMHVSGQQLQQVSGVAAILRYPLPDLDELEELAQEHADNEGRVPEGGGEEEEYDPNRRINEDVHDMGFR
jgi:protein pelota